MDAKTHTRFDARARIIKAMAHPTRLFIIHQLSERECCVCELQKMVGADISTVSKHLTVLRNAGIVQDEKRGLQVFYRLHCPCIMDFFGCVEAVLAENAKDQLKLVRG